MNEFPRLRARVEAAEQRIDELMQNAKHAEAVIVRLAEQINLMQQQRKLGRPKREEPNGTI